MPIFKDPHSKQIFKTWWPLAASWLLMAVEIPALSAVIARLPDARINLAAYGGIIFPLSLIIEAPIIMLLAASVALSKDWPSYLKIRRFMITAGAILTGLHILVAFTPLYDIVVAHVMGVPDEIIEPGRLGLRIMTPWTWAIAYRRFNQGVMIRFGHSDAVGVGTLVRLSTDAIVLAVGYLLGGLPGVAVGAAAQAMGVTTEAIYTGLRMRPVLHNEVRLAPILEVLTWRRFASFYVPLALTTLLTLLWQPIGSAALSRMNLALASLASWQVLAGLTFMLRSPGTAYNEVVVAMLDRPGTYAALRRFTTRLFLVAGALHLIMAATPLARLWFSKVSALPPDLTTLAATGFWLALPLAPITVLQSYFQGAILHGKQTRAIPESVVVFFLTVSILLGAGLLWGQAVPGLYLAMGAFVCANLMQTGWLYVRSKKILTNLET